MQEQRGVASNVQFLIQMVQLSIELFTFIALPVPTSFLLWQSGTMDSLFVYHMFMYFKR